MQIYRVVTESDGETIKSEGERKTEIKQIDRRFAAESMNDVWESIKTVIPYETERLIAVIEEHPSVIILMPKA